jgi:CubicO group peptidase (beta-lactamase class C family)
VETNNFSGVVLVTRDGKTLHRKAYGYADLDKERKHSPESVFQIASLSKPFTACAIMLLQEQDKLSVRDNLTKYIPDYPRGDEITLHHLLTHTSGIPNINSMDIYERLEKRAHTAESLVRYFKNKPLDFNPGEKYNYSNSNYNLLAYIIEEASGKTYGNFLRENIFEPVGMEYTDHPKNQRKPNIVISKGYKAIGATEIEQARDINWTVKTGNGSLYSTAYDLMRFTRALFNAQIINENSLNEVVTSHIDNTGYGWFVRPRHGKKQIHMNGRSPGYTSAISYFPSEDLTVIVLSNNYIPVPTRMTISISAMALGEPYRNIISGEGKTHSKTASKVVGKYKFGPDFYQPNKTLNVIYDDGYLKTEFGVFLHSTQMQFINRDYWADVEFKDGPRGSMIMDYYGFQGKKID